MRDEDEDEDEDEGEGGGAGGQCMAWHRVVPIVGGLWPGGA